MITVKFFAQLRDAVGTDNLQIAAADLEQVYAQLQQSLDSEAWEKLRQDNVRVAVNQNIVNTNPALCHGDEVAFLPPVTGG